MRIEATSLHELSTKINSWIAQGGVVTSIHITPHDSRFYTYTAVLNRDEGSAPQSLREAREVMGLSAQEVADHLDISVNLVYYYEAKGYPSRAHLAALSPIYNLRLEYMIELNRRARSNDV